MQPHPQRHPHSAGATNFEELRALADKAVKRNKIIKVTGLAILAISLLGFLIWVGYQQDWTGFRGYTDSGGEFQRGKTLWDWMQLLIIPAVLASGALLFNWAERRSEREIARQRDQTDRELSKDRIHEAALQSYLDHMTELLLGKGLRASEPDAEVRDVARARTLTTLQGLDGVRKGVLLRFLHESDLIKIDNPVIDLAEADLSKAFLLEANLRGINLFRANLRGANLRRADPSRSQLRLVDLSGANLCEAHLIFAILEDAILEGADLSGAHLNGADLSYANLSKANLRGAALSGANLRKANLHETEIDNTTQIDDKWQRVWEIVNQGAEGRDLSQADLNEAHLRGANLEGADLRRADLIVADLSEANLSKANLNKANLDSANLAGADLLASVLSEATLSDANLSLANLARADLSRANLEGAYLREANLSEAALSGANLSRANLEGAAISEEQLKSALSLEGAIMPDGTMYQAPQNQPE